MAVNCEAYQASSGARKGATTRPVFGPPIYNEPGQC
jgi:hypothetical protein